MKTFFIYISLFVNYLIFSQTETVDAIVLDSLYREDQFYFSLTYNLPQVKPSNYSQNSFSTGLSFGFLRDMPISKNRQWAIATGFGYSYNNIKHNFAVKKSGTSTTYSVDDSYTNNKLVLHYLELPLEIRWRNSTADNHRFWRVYTGFKASYVFSNKAEFKSGTENFTIKNNSDINKLQYGPYFSFGYNTINFYAFYALNPLFKDVSMLSGENVDLKIFNIGFMFYIL
uniref:porin family protein n=1 Tax=Flavobacterium sp. TaxID=239 RepID=UPI00404B3FE0